MGQNLGKFILAAAFILSAASAAHANYPVVRNFSKTEYRSGTQNWSISQDSDGGCVYFANNSGLVEFDGNSWSTYPIKNYTNVRSVLSESGKIYAGGFNEFGFYCLDASGKMEYHSETSRMPIEGGTEEIWKILKLDECLFLQSNKDVLKFDGTSFERYRTEDKIECSAIGRGTVLIATRKNGIMALSGSDFVTMPGSDFFKGKKICAMLNYDKDRIMVVTEEDGIYIYDWNSLAGWNQGDMWRKMSGKQIFCAATDGSSIAFGTVGDGVFIMEGSTGKAIHLDKKTGLQNNTVLSMSFDKSGNLWLGLDKGIDYVILNSPERTLFGSDNTCGAGYASLESGGRLYLGTNQGLYYMEHSPVDGEMKGQIKNVQDMGGQVWCIEEIDGTVFCGNDRGLFVIDGNRTTRIPGISGTWKIMKMRSRQGIIMGCSYDGLFTLRKSGGKWEHHMVEGFCESSGRFEEDRFGCIYLYHWMKGTFRLCMDEECRKVTDITYCAENIGLPGEKNNIPNIYKGDVVLSSDKGFFRYDPDKGKVSPADELNELFQSPPKGLDMSQSPWNDDIIFTSGDMNAIAYTDRDGKRRIDSLALNGIAQKQILGFENICFINGDCILLNTEDGFSIIDTGKIKNGYTKESSLVFIKGISTVNGTEYSPVFGARNPEYASGKEIRVPYSSNSLRFDFVCPQYEDKNAIMYSYMLERYDSQWSEYTAESYKDYTKLPFGRYTFRAKAINLLDNSESETAIQFSIAAPWYASVPAFAFYFFLLSVLGYILLRMAENISKKRTRELEKEKNAEIERLKTQTLENDLKHKSHDLASSTMNLIRKNEILLDINGNINKTLGYIRDAEISKTTKLLNKIQMDIKENIEHDDYWQKFEHNFDIVYESYLKRLGERYPSISIGDKRLCAYLKMGMSSKEIAMLLNMSVHSVEMARYRLRKKMELNREVNLVEFLQHF